jgi:hypothetical protein
MQDPDVSTNAKRSNHNPTPHGMKRTGTMPSLFFRFSNAPQSFSRRVMVVYTPACLDHKLAGHQESDMRLR